MRKHVRLVAMVSLALAACSSQKVITTQATTTAAEVAAAPQEVSEAIARCGNPGIRETLVAVFQAPAASVVRWQEHRDDNIVAPVGIPRPSIPSPWLKAKPDEVLTICYFDGIYYSHSINDNPPLTRSRIIVDSSGTALSDGLGYSKPTGSLRVMELEGPLDAKLIKKPA